MRGKEFLFSANNIPRRITPAYAGKSSLFGKGNIMLKDHPRLCGEKQQQQDIVRWIPGSPPPMRGKGKETQTECCNRRITPAYAGKSEFQAQVNALLEDHPRLCGEKPPTSQTFQTS